MDKIYFIDHKSTKIIIDDPNVLKAVNNCNSIKKGKTKVTVYDNDKIVEKLGLSINQVKLMNLVKFVIHGMIYQLEIDFLTQMINKWQNYK